MKSSILFLKSSILFSTLALGIYPAVAKQQPNSEVSQAEVVRQQKNWCNALIDIGQTYVKNGEVIGKQRAYQRLDDLYAYKDTVVLFKPTLSQKPQTFRTTRDGVVAYFFGHDQNFPNDKGFALKGWVKCTVDNYAFNISKNYALAMGKVYFEDGKGKVTTVDQTWGFSRDKTGKLKISVHHSSLEYQPN